MGRGDGQSHRAIPRVTCCHACALAPLWQKHTRTQRDRQTGKNIAQPTPNLVAKSRMRFPCSRFPPLPWDRMHDAFWSQMQQPAIKRMCIARTITRRATSKCPEQQKCIQDRRRRWKMHYNYYRPRSAPLADSTLLFVMLKLLAADDDHTLLLRAGNDRRRIDTLVEPA